MSKKQQPKVQTSTQARVQSVSDSQSQKLQQQIEELTNSWKRALADYKNLESRMERQRIESMLFATKHLVTKLLSVLDDLDRAVEHHQDQSWISLIRDHLRGILSAEGITEIPVQGLRFDPSTMECTAQVAGEEQKVINVVAKGYTLHHEVLRAAKVEVGKGAN